MCLEPQGQTMYNTLSTDHIHDAISELESIQSHPDTSLCAVIALLYAHKCCDTIGECSYVW